MCTHVCVCTSFSAKESLLLCSFSQALFLVHPQELHLPCPLKLPGVLWPQPELWDAALTLNNNVQVLCHCVGSLRCQFNKINGCLREKCEGGAIQVSKKEPTRYQWDKGSLELLNLQPLKIFLRPLSYQPLSFGVTIAEIL